MALENAPTKTWELNTYEINRRPQEAITDNTLVAVSPRSLQSELMCPICLDILKSTMTTKECLHRFCQVCITTALRSGNKECPTCRKKLVSKRSLRADPNFDSLISKIFPHREEYEAAQEKALERISRQCSAPATCPTTTATTTTNSTSTASSNIMMNSSALISTPSVPLTSSDSCPAPTITSAPSLSSVSSPIESRPSFPLNSDAESSCEGDLLTGELNRRSRVNSDAGSAVETNSIGGSSSIFSLEPQPHLGHQHGPSGSSSGKLSDTPMHPSGYEPSDIELVIRPYPENATSTRRYVGKGELAKYVRCPSSTTIGHLCQYLAVRREDSPGNSDPSYSIFFVSDKGQHTELSPNLSLRDVSEEHWQGCGRFQLFYNLISKIAKKQ